MTGSESGGVSLILTVKDEIGSIDRLLESIARQTRLPDQIIVVDGGSTDGTLDRLQAWTGRLPLICRRLPGASIAQGRNQALTLASGEIVAVTDAGVELEPTWLEELLRPFARATPYQPDVVSGFFRGQADDLFQIALAATTLPDQEEIDPARFLPSSRSVAFRRSLFLAGLRYPEWLDYCEDLIFDLRLRAAGARFEFRPRASVHFMPRPSLGAFARQYYRYARGDGKARLFGRRHLTRYATYLVLVPLVAWRRSLLLAVAGGVVYLRAPWQRLLRRRSALGWRTTGLALLLTPALRLAGDLAKMAGYPVGVWWRWRRYGLRASWRTIPELALGTGSGGGLDQGVTQELGAPEASPATQL